MGLAELEQHLRKTASLPLVSGCSETLKEWGPHPGGLSDLAGLNPPIHMVVGDFSPWLTPDLSAWSYRMDRVPRTTLHALRPRIRSWRGKRGLIWMLGFEPSRTARLLEDIVSEVGSSHHPVRERLVIVTSEN